MYLVNFELQQGIALLILLKIFFKELGKPLALSAAIPP